MVTLETLAAATSKMRKAQKDYFALRGNKRLKEAKDAEAEVDRMLISLAPDNAAVRANISQQSTLFG